MKTMICLILDRSGSMSGRETDVIGGVNSFLAEQRKLPNPASIAFVRFDDAAIERFRPMQALAECKDLTATDYQPRGGTPLLDAVGKTIAQLDEDWKTERPERAIMVIVTDGQENASHEYKKAQIADMIKARQDSGKWAFMYLGANVDAFAEAGSMGIAMANTAGYVNTSRGTRSMYATASNAVQQMRASGATLAHNLGKNIGEDDVDVAKVYQPLTSPVTAAQPTWTAPQATTTWQPPA